MRHYSRINEDYLDKSDIELDDVSVLDDVRFEIDRWISGGPAPSFDVKRLPDGFYKPVAEDSLDNIILLKRVIVLACEEYGYECSLNWINVSHIDNMAWLFNTSMFNGDISRWDVSRVTNMYCMFFRSDFDNDISRWNTARVQTMYQMFSHSSFNHDISGWNVSRVTNHVDMFEGCPIRGDFKPHGFMDELPNKR